MADTPEVAVYRYHPKHGYQEIIYEGPQTDGVEVEDTNGQTWRVSVERADRAPDPDGEAGDG